MLALSLWEPWGSLIAIGAKQIETRSWPTQHRGEIAIHAAQTWNDECDLAWHSEPFGAVLLEAGLWEPTWKRPTTLAFGCILAVATLTHCVPTTAGSRASVEQKYGSNEVAFGNFAPGRYGLVLKDVQRLATPVPCRGAQKLWSVPEDVEAQVRAQLAVPA
jgi:activating signal cointegrator 1